MPIQTAADSISNSQGSPFGFKNRIINGAMVIDQRNAGASVTITSDNTFITDRWSARSNVSSKYSAQQSSTAPTGFNYSLLATSLSAYSVGAAEYFAFTQGVEGFNCADFGWGTANAQTVTLSFWVRSSLTGTFGGSLRNSDGTRSYPFTYTISSANTFEYKTITVSGDTSGTWITNNGLGIRLYFGLGVGSTYRGTAGSWASANYLSATSATSVVGTNGATFYITGVQLEKGSTATSFDYRPYGTELALCQRYFQKVTNIYVPDSASLPTNWYFKVSMRATPTITGSGAGFGTFALNSDSVASRQTSAGGGTLTADIEL